MAPPKVCPYWVGYLLLSPLRRLLQDPDRILDGLVAPGMTVLDVGSAMGYFSLPLARRVAPGGRAICVDLQERMLRALERRARKAGVWDLIEARPCTERSLGLADLEGKVDFALAFAMVHEVPDPGRLFEELHRALKPASLLLMAEPKGHVGEGDFRRSVSAAEERGFVAAGKPRIFRSRSVLLRRGGDLCSGG